MGEETKAETETEELDQTEEEITEEESGELQGQEEEDSEEAQGEEDSEADEVEVVREGEGSLPKSNDNAGVRKRINRLNARNEETEKGKTEAEKSNDLLREENKLLNLRLNQVENAPKAPTKPKSDDFEDGAHDPKFIEAQDKYDDYRIDKKVQERLTQTQNTSAEADAVATTQRDLEIAQEAHYAKVAKFKVPDYNAREDKVIERFGVAFVNDIIDAAENPHHLLYYLGTDSDAAVADGDKIIGALKTKLARGVIEIGRLQERLKVKPKSRKAPDPDEELSGGIKSSKDNVLKGAKFS